MARDRREHHPVLVGLIALAGVGLVVGVLVSIGALGASRVLGLGESGGSGGTASAQESMFLPEPVPTPEESGALLTLAPEPTPDLAGTGTPAPLAPTSAAPTGITLAASATQVGPGDKVTLSGSYPGAEGATLAVERLTGSTWASFADVTATVRGDSFSTYIRTSQSGESRFRVRDVSSDVASNEVTFTIG